MMWFECLLHVQNQMSRHIHTCHTNYVQTNRGYSQHRRRGGECVKGELVGVLSPFKQERCLLPVSYPFAMAIDLRN